MKTLDYQDNQDSVLSLMPSLLQDKPNLQFGTEWPLSRKLPALNYPTRQLYKKKETSPSEITYVNLKAFYQPQCQHNRAKKYAKNLCKTCYHNYYNQVLRRIKKHISKNQSVQCNKHKQS